MRIHGWLVVALLVLAAGNSRPFMRAVHSNGLHKFASSFAAKIVHVAAVRPDAVVVRAIDPGDLPDEREYQPRNPVLVRAIRVAQPSPGWLLTPPAANSQSQLRI